MKIPKPTAAYKTQQAEYQQLMQKESRENSAQRRALTEVLRGEFMKALNLEPDKGKVTSRFYNRHVGLFSVGFWDHPSLYRRGENLVIVGQPYGYDAARFKKWLAHMQADGTEASAWAFYFPGRANLLIAEFTPEAKAALDKRRTLKNREEGSYYFEA